jgi:hypothetical protein
LGVLRRFFLQIDALLARAAAALLLSLRCYLNGFGAAEDKPRGLALGRDSETLGSCFGQDVVGRCLYFEGHSKTVCPSIHGLKMHFY